MLNDLENTRYVFIWRLLYHLAICPFNGQRRNRTSDNCFFIFVAECISKIKIKEIKKLGFIPYIIQDLGKYNPNFVESEFKKFIEMVADHDLNVNYAL